MSKYPKYLMILLPVLFSSSCAGTIDKNLSPPSDTQWVNIEIKNPSQYTKPFPLEVVYISHKCLKSSINGIDGSREEKQSYNGVKIPLQQQGNSDLWHAKVAMNGGGSCDWTLSEFNLGIEYIDATHLGKDLVPGTAVGATIALDDIAASNGTFKETSGDLTLKTKYYPYIKRYSKIKNSKDLDALSLFGRDNSFSNYRVNSEAGENFSVIYHPVIDESKIAQIIFPYQKGKGVHTKVVYPDKTEFENGSNYPDFNKMESIK